MPITKHLTPNDFVLIVRPILEEKNSENEDELTTEQYWTGEVQVGIVADDENTELSEDEFASMIALCNCTAASIPAMEENTLLREIIQVYAQKQMITPNPETLKAYQDNVLTLATNTKGNA